MAGIDTSHHNALPAGYKLHWYEVRSLLGQGGFGITYLAHDLNLQKQVAIKEYFPTDFAQRDGHKVVPLSDEVQAEYQWGLDRFVAEARTLSKFDHPNIVKVHAVFEENGTGYMVMSYESGHSLQTTLENNKQLDEATLLAIVRPLLNGLALVHEHNFIHRDIKPDNIFIRTDGTPALLDFGSARPSLDGKSSSMTVLVTPGYAPVEQYYSDGGEQGPWTDIYGLGATLYRAITGKPLANAVDRSKSVLNKTMDASLEALDLKQTNYSKKFLKAVEHAIQFDPSARPQTVAQWRDELPNPIREGATKILTNEDLMAAGALPNKSKKNWVVALIVILAVCSAGAGFYLYETTQATKKEMAAAPDKAADPSSVTHEVEPVVVAQPTDDIEVGAAQSIDLQQSESEESEESEDKIETQRLIEEAQARLVQQRKVDAEKSRLEEAKLALIAEQEAFAEQQKLAAIEQAEQEALARQNEIIEQKIEKSRADFAKRYALLQDNHEYKESAENIDLTARVPQSFSVPIYANITEWQSTGVTIRRGTTYKLDAEGIWRMGPLCKPTDANGEGMYALLCVNLGGQTVANYPHSALIAKIGNDTLPFFVGTEFSFTADREGMLYMRSNDLATGTADNSASLNVTITLVE